MKNHNQYNLLKSIDRNSSSSATGSVDISPKSQESSCSAQNEAVTQQLRPSKQQQTQKSSFSSKLHNLVAAKLISNNGNNHKLSSTPSFSFEQTKGKQDKKLEERNGRIFSLSTSYNEVEQQQQQRQPATGKPQRASMQQAGVAKIRQLPAETAGGRTPISGGVNLSSSRKKVPQPDNKLQSLTLATTTTTNQTATTIQPSPTTVISERLAPELAKCYDEIDQIYDYIRGLAPLPMQLRKIKSIDFEQLEREKRHQQIEAANNKLVASHNQQQQRLLSKQKQLIERTSSPNCQNNGEQARLHRPIKVRQREANDLKGDQLKEPTGINGSSKQQQLASTTIKQRIEGPLPIKVVTSSCNERLNIERVESLNLGSSALIKQQNGVNNNNNNRSATTDSVDNIEGGNAHRAAQLAAGARQQQQQQHSIQRPAYLISSAQRGELFRLPRAHSTSTLNKSLGIVDQAPPTTTLPADKRLLVGNNNNSKSARDRIKPTEEEDADRGLVNARTLPPLRLSRVSMLEPMRVASLGRSGNNSKALPLEGIISGQNEFSKISAQRLNKQLDLVESFVDDVSSVNITSSSSSSSSSSTATATSTATSTTSSSSSSPSSSSASSSSSTAASSSASRSSSPSPSSAAAAAARRSNHQSDSEKGDKIKPGKLVHQEINSPNKQVLSSGGGFTASTKSDKWAEKSHSDYENDTVSLSSDGAGDSSKASGSLSDLLQTSTGCNKLGERTNRIRRSSSGTGTAGGGEFNESSSSNVRAQANGDSGQRSNPAARIAPDCEEHIYEQIPAHKNLMMKRPHLSTPGRPQSLPHRHLLESSYSQYRNHQSQQGSSSSSSNNNNNNNSQEQPAKPYNYPIAYAASVAPAKRHQVTTAYLASSTGPSQAVRTSVHDLAAVQRQRMKAAAQGGTYPFPIGGQHSQSRLTPAQHSNSNSNSNSNSSSYRANHMQAARRLDHRQGLSMNNLHLLSYFNQPNFMNLYHTPSGPQQRQQAAQVALAGGHLSRSSSSSKVNRMRAPRLSPGQLIAQIQMPRAVNKRRQHQEQFSQFTAPTTNGKLGGQEQHRPVFVWRQANGPSIVHQAADYLHGPRIQAEQRQARRLTAIGIGLEEALEQCVRGRAAPKQVGAAPDRARPIAGQRDASLKQTRQQTKPHQLATQSASRPLSARHLHLGASGAGYFEPPQLIKAPLIDADDELMSPECSSPERADEEEAAASCGQLPSNKLLAHQQAANFIQARCLNSISDLRSSISASSSTDDDERNELHESSSESPGAHLSHRSAMNGQNKTRLKAVQVNKRPNAGDQLTSDEADGGDFVSSRSFIKCYYGRGELATIGAGRPASAENEHDEQEQEQERKGSKKGAKRSKQKDLANKESTDGQVNEASPKSVPKKKGSERLLNLIGMSINRHQSSSHEKQSATSIKHSNKLSGSDSSAGQRRHPRAASPIGAMFVAAQQQQPTTTTTTNSVPAAARRAAVPLVTSPILMGDFLNTDGPILVRDKRIAALRSDLVRHYQHPTVQVSKMPNFASNKTRSSAESRGSKQATNQLDQTGSTNTTNSTSSYEAAIKNSQKADAKVNEAQIEDATDSGAIRGYSKRELAKKSNSSSANKHASNKANNTASANSNQAAMLIKVPKLSKQSHLLNRPLPKPPCGSGQHAQPSGGRRNPAALAQVQRADQCLGQKQQLANLSRLVGPLAQAKAATRKPLVSTNLDLGQASNELRSMRSNQPFETCPRPQAGESSSGSSSSRSKAATKEQRKAVGSSLSPLSPATMAAHPSPTVTTCTSSGISSRLTGATHLANSLSNPNSNSNSNSSSQRSGSSKRNDEQRVKSFSELHKQAKAAAAERSMAATNTSSGASTGCAESLNEKLGGASFVLMDDSESLPSSPDCHESQPISGKLAAGLGEQLSSNSTGFSAAGFSGPTKRAITSNNKRSAKNADEKAFSNNLKLFDERFSSKFMDSQLASSNDSLLESINFSGTLNRKMQLAAKQQH